MPNERTTTEIIPIGNIVLVRWAKRPSEKDTDRILAEMKRVHEEQKKKSIYLAIVPADAEIPKPEERDALGRLARSARADCDALHVVLEGSGFKHSVQRGVATGFTLIFRQKGFIQIHATLDEALDKIALTSAADRDRVRAAVRA